MRFNGPDRLLKWLAIHASHLLSGGWVAFNLLQSQEVRARYYSMKRQRLSLLCHSRAKSKRFFRACLRAGAALSAGGAGWITSPWTSRAARSAV